MKKSNVKFANFSPKKTQQLRNLVAIIIGARGVLSHGGISLE